MTQVRTARAGRKHLSLVVAENARREQTLMLEGACQHRGQIFVTRETYDGVSDHSTEYGVCMACKAKVCITVWLGRAKNEQCYEVRLLTPNECRLLFPENAS